MLAPRISWEWEELWRQGTVIRHWSQEHRQELDSLQEVVPQVSKSTPTQVYVVETVEFF